MINEAIFRAAFWFLLGSLWLMRVIILHNVRLETGRFRVVQKAVQREGRWLFIGRTALLGYTMILLALYAYNPAWIGVLSIAVPVWLRWVGFGLGLASLGLWTWTQAILGKEWSAQLQVKAEHRLVTGGPYAWVRHPMYTAMFGMGAAFAFLTANWGFFIFAVAMIAGFVLRAPREEQMLLDAFGEEYRAYQQKTGRFFPRLGKI
jgi:protein-S-isoprenylcysteine O-methyltransferase Ste14